MNAPEARKGQKVYSREGLEMTILSLHHYPACPSYSFAKVSDPCGNEWRVGLKDLFSESPRSLHNGHNILAEPHGPDYCFTCKQFVS